MHKSFYPRILNYVFGISPVLCDPIVQAARTPFQRAVLMALYATGGRRAEVATTPLFILCRMSP